MPFLHDRQKQAVDALRSLSKFETSFDSKITDQQHEAMRKTLSDLRLHPALQDLDLSGGVSPWFREPPAPIFFFDYSQPNWKRALDVLFQRNYESFSDKLHHYVVHPHNSVAYHIELGRYIIASYKPMQHRPHHRRTYMAILVRHIFTKD